MKAFKYILVPAIAFVVLSACEKKVDLDLPNEDPFLVVDAWLTNETKTQQIVLSYIHPYLDNNKAPVALGAEVAVLNIDKQDTLWFMDEDGDGTYIWDPVAAGKTLGEVGDRFALGIDFEGTQYFSQTQLAGVPPVDSITYEYYPKDLFIKEDYYIGEFWARDLGGPDNTYWIKTWKNSVFLNKPEEINIAYDAAFSGGTVDSLYFISPIRTLMNPFDQYENGDYIPPYAKGDTAYVEVHSVSNEAWFFLARVIDETNVSGGFGALFATPLANVPTNIVSNTENVKVVGFFNVASVSSLEQIVNEESIRDNIKD